jgi:hypothetical protein
MSITINIRPELEEILKQMAIQEGKGVDSIIIELLEGQLLSDPNSGRKNIEMELLRKVNLNITVETWERYYTLIEKREAEILTEAEYQELLALTDKIEIANANRIENLILLSKLRKVSVEELMEELGIRPQVYGR